ncbi:MAG: hypothetical protein M3R02_02690 [Chloroflexota bacterium]|nr:hypothetical protein [Chloroflexota bacterium]
MVRYAHTVPAVQFVSLQLACPQCGAPVALAGQLALVSTPRVSVPCRVCGWCGTTVVLTRRAG